MNNKLNIEEIKLLIPDYITGSLEDKDKITVENALSESAVLREFYNEMKGTFEFVSAVKFEEPSPQYWNSLLPRIHEKLEAKSRRKFSWDSIAAIWKIIVPVSAVILIFVAYQLLKSPENQISKKQINTGQIENKDSNSSIKQEIKEDKKDSQNQSIDKNQENLSNGTPDNVKAPKVIRKTNIIKQDKKSGDNVAEDIKKNDDGNTDINNKGNEDISAEEFASIDPEDLSVLAGSTHSVIDEETEGELDRLNGNEKDQLIEDLLKTNL
jgi:hypothetical protein